MAGGRRKDIREPMPLPSRMYSLVEVVGMCTNIQISVLTRVTAEAGSWYQRSVKRDFRQSQLELSLEGCTDKV